MLSISSFSQQHYEPFKIKPIESPSKKKDTIRQKDCEIKDIGDTINTVSQLMVLAQMHPTLEILVRVGDGRGRKLEMVMGTL